MYETIKETSGGIILEGVTDFNLTHVFECGQCFRWNRQEDGSYSGVAHGKYLRLTLLSQDSQSENPGLKSSPQDRAPGNSSTGFSPESGLSRRKNTLLIQGCTEDEFYETWEKYFDLKRDYGKIKEELCSDDTIMAEAAAFGYGIRLLNQDEWETLISFILSQNRNIPLIKRSVEDLSALFGEKITCFDGITRYAFPTPEALASLTEEDLAPCKLGYRAKYVINTAKAVAENPEKLYYMTHSDCKEAFDYLNSLCGVGPKVANCVMLFSMEKYDSFPVDVWVRRLMSVLYGADESRPEEAAAIAAGKFGSLGGFAQQYLFYFAREKGLGK